MGTITPELKEIPDRAVDLAFDTPSHADQLSNLFRAVLRRVTDTDAGYWNYDAIKSNSNPHAYFQYPAMMVPQMQRDIIEAIVEVFPGTRRTLDPFAGSGTILTESLKLGLSSIAVDINPMALLLCKVKSAGFSPRAVEFAFERVVELWRDDSSEEIEISYQKRHKWFCNTALIELSRVFRAIQRTESLEIRRLLWLAFADAVRLTSNSRTSTYKLHIRDEADILRRTERVGERIESAMRRAISLYAKNANTLEKAGITKNGQFKKARSVTILGHDMREPLPRMWADALISSPPYGDNHTTVTYGQHSFLPLLWIPLSDIDPNLSRCCLDSTHAIDSMSLGGIKEGYRWKLEAVKQKSATITSLLDNSSLDLDASQRLGVFFFDLEQSLSNAVKLLRSRSPIVLTLGNRSVRSIQVPMDTIVKEFMERLDCEYIDQHRRAIPTKRMAHRNQSSGTMLTEVMLVMRSPKR